MDWSSILFVSLYAGLLQCSYAQDTNSPPEWVPSSYSSLGAGIAEDTAIGTTVATLSCTDRDGDRVKYRKVTSDAFDVSFFGHVILRVQLDFEAEDKLGSFFEFQCVDVDGAGQELHNWVSADTEFSIDDANDIAPVFQINNPEGYSFQITEDAAVGTTLTPFLTIIDGDRTVFAQLDQLYFICDSTNQTVLNNEDPTSIETCNKFGLEYTQRGEGEYVAKVVLEAPLNYEERPVYSSKIIAVDGPGDIPSLSTTVNIQFNLIDAQDVLPYFTNPGASTTVPENIPVGTTLAFAVSAQDGDTGARRPVNITILEDLNDVFTLLETRETFIDSGIYASSLLVRNELDREKVSGAYAFIVKATEYDVVGTLDNTATATATYSVFVSDINDNIPTFNEELYSVNVTELTVVNLATYQPVQIANLHIQCNDQDLPSNANYSVRIVFQTFPPAYSISPNVDFFTGAGSMFLQVDDPTFLDYDIPQYRNQLVVLEARELNTIERFSSSVTISLRLVDINDNSPQFLDQTYEVSVSENTRTFPHFLLNVTATDADSGQNGQINYILEGGTNDKFSINPNTGELSLVQAVDYEFLSQYVFLVLARDGAEIPRSTQVQVTVNVLNYNDLGPQFVQSTYETSADETSLNFFNPIIVRAVDNEDSSLPITYSIVGGQSPNDAFRINDVSGELVLRTFLDYDDTPLLPSGQKSGYFLLTIEASDNGIPPQTNIAQVRVNVIDENNHPPVLARDIINVTISELVGPGTVLVTIVATDLDGGSFGEITYRLGPGNSGNFRVDALSGNFSVSAENNLDYDTTDQYEVLILATDGGAPQLTATATVLVTITDANNKAPEFPEYVYRASVDENEPLGTTVLRAQARDMDSRSRLEYYIDSDSIEASDASGNILSNSDDYNFRETFDINNSGDIIVNGMLDKDQAQEISFIIVVQDVNSETGLQTATAEVSIFISGEPNTDITFDPFSISYVNEDESVGERIVILTARDPKAGARITNYIKNDFSSDFFSVETTTGGILLAKPVNFETDSQNHVVYVVAIADDGLRSATATVSIIILDLNDNAPVFQRDSYFAQISESAQYPTEVASVLATDVDSSTFGPVTYRIAGGLGADDFFLFERDRDAVILVAAGRTLDFNERRQYQLDIVAVDNPSLDYSSVRLTGSVVLTIQVIDENNNIPYFKENFRSYSVPETAYFNQEIDIVRAFDDDFGNNGDIVYTLEAVNEPDSITGLTLFDISPNLGSITVVRSLLGLGGKIYPMLVRARDKGEVPNSNTMRIEIEVFSTENNDGNPKWIRPVSNYVLYAPEETPNYVLKDNEGRELFLDANPANGTNITFSLSIYSESYNSFQVDPLTGRITVVDSLDREVQESYIIQVYAEDTVNPLVLRSGRSLIVTLLDKNDNDATFTNPRGYALCEPTIDRPQNVYVMENTPAETTVYVVRACDPDGSEFGTIRYEPYTDNLYCQRGAEASGLRVESDGRLITNRTVDYEENREFIMCVRAISMIPANNRKKRAFELSQAEPLRDDVAYIEVVIVDVNDNGPKFLSPEVTAVVQTNPKTGPVLTLRAIDADGVGYNTTLYLIESSSFYPQGGAPPVALLGAFTIRGSGGGVFPALPSYREFTGGRFVLRVVAIDSRNTSLTDRQKVTIYVHEQGQAMKVILNLRPEDGFLVGESLINELNSVSDQYELAYLHSSENINQGGVDTRKTDVCFLAVDSASSNILNIRQVIELLDQNRYQMILLEDEYMYIDRGQCYPALSSEDKVKWRDLWWVLVAVAIFVFVCSLIMVVLVIILYSNYKRYMETRKTYMVQQ